MSVAVWLVVVAFAPSASMEDGGVDGQMLFEIGRDVFDAAQLETWDEGLSLLRDLPGMHGYHEIAGRVAFEHIASAGLTG